MLALAACSSQPAEQDAGTPDETALSEVDGPSAPRKAATPAAVPTRPGTALPPADAERRYVGRWASRPDLCDGGAWVFARDHFGLEDGPMCEFGKVTAIPGGYRIAARCDQRGQQIDETLTLRFAESARAMLVEGLSVLPDTGLVYCGPA